MTDYPYKTTTMKTMTCQQFGGACEQPFTANTFDEIAKLSEQHAWKCSKPEMTLQHLMHYLKISYSHFFGAIAKFCIL